MLKYDPTKEGWLACKIGEISPLNNKLCLKNTKYLIYSEQKEPFIMSINDESKCDRKCQILYSGMNSRLRTDLLHSFLEDLKRKIASYQPDMSISKCIDKSANSRGNTYALMKVSNNENRCICVNYLEFAKGIEDLAETTLECSKKSGYSESYYKYDWY
ncbi:hypothetical protein CH365_19530 [Leptospira neocaledonica]|uniref:Uncharacterized protein n=1 Tax=Leptospira neocaledonica TaxID=2023192 RepID=A0A2M9ZTJ1_9LEPT|nr:hypothetical protein CH365_19530 [Leptospira neocaledonica]